MNRSSFSESNSHSANQEIPCLSYNPKAIAVLLKMFVSSLNDV